MLHFVRPSLIFYERHNFLQKKFRSFKTQCPSLCPGLIPNVIGLIIAGTAYNWYSASLEPYLVQQVRPFSNIFYSKIYEGGGGG